MQSQKHEIILCWGSYEGIARMQKEKGASLKGKALDLFIRMIQTAIPQKSLQNLGADYVTKLNSHREITWVGCKKDET